MPTLDDLVTEARARIGRVLAGKWRLDDVLGVGGMAAVYAATHRNQKRVAIKMLHGHVASDRRTRARFLREGYLANSVDHPGVVTVDDDGEDDGAAFLVMELLRGQTVDEKRRAAGGALPAAEVIAIAAQLLDVLVVAHDRGIVHRDLKPENLFCLDSGALKVLDFGLARLREPDGSHGSLTQPEAVLGTPTFMAPEQAIGRWDLVDGRTDLWAVGATMSRLLTGRHVHEGETIQQQIVLAATAHARPLVGDDVVPAPLARVVDRALAFSRLDRFEDARAMLEALADAASELGISLPALPERPRPPRVPSAPSLSDASLGATTHSTAAPGRTPGPSAEEIADTVVAEPLTVVPARPASRLPAVALAIAGVAVGAAIATVIAGRVSSPSAPVVAAPPVVAEAPSTSSSSALPAASSPPAASSAEPRRSSPPPVPRASAAPRPAASPPPPATPPVAPAAPIDPPPNPLDKRR